jgi:hypothetical protein
VECNKETIDLKKTKPCSFSSAIEISLKIVEGFYKRKYHSEE